MTPEQADTLVIKVIGIDARITELAQLRPTEDMWLMVIGCCLVMLVFFQGVKFWQGFSNAN